MASTTASLSIRSGAGVGPATTAKPAPVRASSRTVMPVRTGTLAASASVSLAMPPGSPAKTGRSLAGSSTPSSGPFAARDDQLRHGGPGREPPGMAGVHAAEQRLHEPVDHLVAEPARDQVADREVIVDREPGLLGLDPGQPLLGEHARTRAAPPGRVARP